MLDTVTLTKAAAAFLGAWLIFLLGSWAADSLFTIGHKGDQQAYIIPTEDDEPAEEVEELTMEEKFAQADAGKGERVFGKCRACHQLEDGANATGPHLYAVVGREVGVVDGFNYSGVLSEHADVWSEENLYAFLEDPRGWAPGTSMSFAGLDAWEDRVNLIAYLQANTN